MQGSTEPVTGAISVESYCLGLIKEEMGEVATALGKADRFGMDSPMRLDDPETTARVAFETELGEVVAAIIFGRLHGVVDSVRVDRACGAKLAKLASDATDNLGRRLAPELPEAALLSLRQFLSDPRYK